MVNVQATWVVSVLVALFCVGPTGAQDAPDPQSVVADRSADRFVPDDRDRSLVRAATRLLERRARGEITFRAYQSGVETFRQNHPGFYGAFFGDPFHYRAENIDLVQQRQLVNLELFPWSRFSDDLAFRCHPYAFDPYLARYARSVSCRGFQFPISEFSVYPDLFPQPDEQLRRVRVLPPVQPRFADRGTDETGVPRPALFPDMADDETDESETSLVRTVRSRDGGSRMTAPADRDRRRDVRLPDRVEDDLRSYRPRLPYAEMRRLERERREDRLDRTHYERTRYDHDRPRRGNRVHEGLENAARSGNQGAGAPGRSRGDHIEHGARSSNASDRPERSRRDS
jgi:hypothetical protein